MTPILYDATETAFSTMGLGALGDALDIDVHTVLNGLFELEMEYPVTGRRYKDLKISNIIKVEAEKNGTPQLFDIYAISKPMNGIVTVNASHVSGRKQYIPIMPCTAANVVDAFDAIDDNAAENNPFTFWTNKDTVATFRLKTPASLGQVLGGMEGSILDTYRGEYEFDNFMIKFWGHRGQDNGVTLRYGKNITSIEQEESIASTITGICPYWADMDGNSITLPEKTVDSAYAANFPFKRTVTVDFSADFDEAPTEAQLRARAQAYVSRSGIGVPSVGLDVAYENLADYEEYKDVALLEQVKLGDTVHVYFEPLDITAEARVTETYYKPLLGKYKKVRIGSAKMSLQQTINGVSEEVNQAVKSVSGITGKLEQAFQEALDLFSGAEGGSIVINRNAATGKPYEILALDTDDASTAQNVIRINNAGIAVSTNGILGSYAIAMTGAGIVANSITAGVLQGIRIIAEEGLIGGWNILETSLSKDGSYDVTNVDVRTISYVYAYIKGTIDLETAIANGADINGDGVVDMLDAALGYVIVGQRIAKTGNFIAQATTENGFSSFSTLVDGKTVFAGGVHGVYGKAGVFEEVRVIHPTDGSIPYIHMGFNGLGLTLDPAGTLLGSANINANGIEFLDASGNRKALYPAHIFGVTQGLTRLATRTANSYGSTSVINLEDYSYFLLVATRGVGNGVMEQVTIPKAIAQKCTSDANCSWVYSAQNGQYNGQCYFDYTNNRVYLKSSGNADCQVELYGYSL